MKRGRHRDHCSASQKHEQDGAGEAKQRALLERARLLLVHFPQALEIECRKTKQKNTADHALINFMFASLVGPPGEDKYRSWMMPGHHLHGFEKASPCSLLGSLDLWRYRARIYFLLSSLASVFTPPSSRPFSRVSLTSPWSCENRPAGWGRQILSNRNAHCSSRAAQLQNCQGQHLRARTEQRRHVLRIALPDGGCDGLQLSFLPHLMDSPYHPSGGRVYQRPDELPGEPQYSSDSSPTFQPSAVHVNGLRRGQLETRRPVGYRRRSSTQTTLGGRADAPLGT